MNWGILAGIASAGLWAGASTLMASATTRMDALSVSAIRTVWGTFSLLLLVPWSVVSGPFEGLTWEATGGVMGSALIGFVLGDTLYIASLNALGVGRGFTTSLGLYVLFTFALSVLLLDADVSWPTVGGSVLILAGVYAVALKGRATRTDTSGVPTTSGEAATRNGVAETGGSWWSGQLARGLLLVTSAAAFWAVATVWLDDASHGHDPIVVSTVRLPIAAVVLVGAALLRRGSGLRTWRITRRDQVALLISGMAGTGVGAMLFVYAVQEAGAGRAAVVTAISPLFAVPLGAIFLKERLTLWLVVGVLAAVAGIVLIS